MATEKQPVSPSDFAAGIFDLDGATEFKKIMVYGDSGAGKTVLAGSLPGRTLFLAGEPGYISAARRGATGQVRTIPDPATALAAIEWLEDGNARRYDWVVADGISTMNAKWILAYAAEAFDANPAKRTHRNLPDKPDYFNAQNFMKSWVARFIDLPAHVLFTAHAMRPEGDSGEQLVYPAIQGKGYEVSNFVAGMMHAVGFMSVRIRGGEDPAQVRRILWQYYHDPKSDTKFFAKDQFDRLPLYTDDLSMSEILAIIDGEREVERAPLIIPQEKPAVKKAGPRKATARR